MMVVPWGVPPLVLGTGFEAKFPSEQPRLKDSPTARVSNRSTGRRRLRMGSNKQKSAAKAMLPVSLPGMDGLISPGLNEATLGAVVTTVIVVVPPPASVAGEKEQVMRVLGAGVQPKMTLRAKPFAMPRMIVAWPVCPWVRVRDCGTKVRL